MKVKIKEQKKQTNKQANKTNRNKTKEQILIFLTAIN